MEEKLIELLEKTGKETGGNVEIHEQGSLTDAEGYPEHFFTYWLDDIESAEYYDNVENAYIWRFAIHFYSVNPTFATETLIKAIERLKKNGWIVDGKGRGAYSDVKTHSGRTVEVAYIEKEEK